MATLQNEVKRLRDVLRYTVISNNKCSVCGTAFCMDGSDRNKEAVLDHDHDINLCRGLLCRWCNMVEGMYTASKTDAERVSAVQRGCTVTGMNNADYEHALKTYLERGLLPFTYPRQEMVEKPIMDGEFSVEYIL